MKKILSVLVCLSLIFVVSGCAKIDETWKNMTGEGGEITPGEWKIVDSEVSPDGSGVIEEENSVKYADDTVLEVPEYESNALKYAVNDAQYGSRNITVRYGKVNIDYQKIVDGIVSVKDSSSDEEMVSNAKSLAELLNSNLNMGLTIASDGSLVEIDENRKDIRFEGMDGYNIVVTNSNTFQSSVSLECTPMSVKTKSDVLEYLKPFGDKLGIDLFNDSDFVNALNDITYEIPMNDLETKDYNHLYISVFDDSLDEEVLTINILGNIGITVDSEVPYYSVSLTVKLSQPRYEEIKGLQ